MPQSERVKLHTLLGDYPGTQALKKGEAHSSLVEFDFAEAKVPSASFKQVVREQKFDVSELAIVTFLMARAYGKPLVLVPAVVLGRFQHPFIVYNAERGPMSPADLAGRRIGVRSYSVTTVAWIRGILTNDHNLDIDRVRWVTFEDSHLAEYRDPPNAERAPAGKDLTAMLLEGELDAAILGAVPKDPRLQPLFADPAAEARRWYERNHAPQINHMVVVKPSLSKSNPEAVREVYRLLAASKKAAGLPAAGEIDTTPFGLEANRRGLEIIIDYVFQQRLIPKKFEVDELFDDVTRSLG